MKPEEIATQKIGLDEIEINHNTHMKLGIDATSPHLHLGHLVPFTAFKRLLERGCKGTIVLGDLTAQIGDPSGQNRSRPILTPNETTGNALQLKEQITRFLGQGNWNFVRNSDLQPTLQELLPLLQSVSINSMLGRDHFSLRHERGDSISLLEMFCPVLQGWDSVRLKCDLELGGNDQFANCTLARDLMAKLGQKKQAFMLFPILTGTDGKNKMSKSLGNHISMNDSAKDVFGKTMSIPDTIVEEWFRLLLHQSMPHGSPLENKQVLAMQLTEKLHGVEAATEAAAWFDRTFREKKVDATESKEIKTGATVIDALVETGIATSRSAARRLITGNGVKIDGVTVTDDDTISRDCVLQKGKRTAVRLGVQ